MTPLGFDPDEQHVQEEASILKLKVAMVLLAEARRRGDFGNEAELKARAAELADEVSGGRPSPDPRRPLIEVGLLRADRIALSVAFEEGSATVASLTIDGILFDQATVGSVRAVQIDRDQLSEEERADLDRRRAEREERMERERQFTATRFRRAVAAPPQPGAAMRILAVLLYGDGFAVDHTREGESPDLVEIGSADEYFDRDREQEPRIQVEDDLGTEYFESGGSSWGGMHVSRGTAGFAPAPPAEARVLRITTDSGTVELDLQH
jgi:hypothetical protein